jgi:hypothetical protein
MEFLARAGPGVLTAGAGAGAKITGVWTALIINVLAFFTALVHQYHCPFFFLMKKQQQSFNHFIKDIK